jgi:hypothetical protein
MRCHNPCRQLTILALISLLFATIGCHHVKIDSGLEPSPQVYNEEWNMAYAYAIFPAQVDAAEYCGGRWARVETRQSFLNWVVGAITWGIITPMETKVVCAATGDGEGDSTDAPPATANSNDNTARTPGSN